MKISCPSCESKYTIADEKVQGRSVKVRCRKCGETIHVTSAGATIESAGSPSAGEVQSDGGAAFSVLVAEGDQRDMAVPEIVAAYNSGLVTADTYVWGEGQSDWMPLGQVAAIVEAINQASAAVDAAREAAHEPEPPPQPAAAAPAADMFGAAPAAAPAADMFAAAPVPQPVQHAAVREDRRRDVDLFGSRKSEEDVATSAPPVRDVVAPAGPTGTRDESSMLFSLSALTASTPGQGPSSPGAPTTKDDSGLIDLKALAAKADAPSTASAPMAASILDAAPLLGTPLIDMPTTSEPEAESKKSKAPIFIGVGIGVAGIAIAAALFIGTRKPPAPPAVPAASITAAPTETVAAVPTSTDSGGAAPPSTGAPSATAKPVAGGGKVGAGGKTTKKGGDKVEPGAAAPTAPATAKTPPKSKCGCAPTDLACNMACAAK
jgi:predicted Zn finger-like uncharacterized protein